MDLFLFSNYPESSQQYDNESKEEIEDINDQQNGCQILEEKHICSNPNSQSQLQDFNNPLQRIVNDFITTKQIIVGDQHTENNEIDQQKKSNQIKVIGKKQKSEQNQIEDVGVKYYPGDSKNIPKNFGGHFKNYIKELCEQNQIDLDDQHWQAFCKINNQKISKYNLGEFLQTKYGRMFGKEFFGQCLWAKPFLLENKSDIQQYFAFNKYKKKVKTNDQQ